MAHGSPLSADHKLPETEALPDFAIVLRQAAGLEVDCSASAARARAQCSASLAAPAMPAADDEGFFARYGSQLAADLNLPEPEAFRDIVKALRLAAGHREDALFRSPLADAVAWQIDDRAGDEEGEVLCEWADLKPPAVRPESRHAAVASGRCQDFVVPATPAFRSQMGRGGQGLTGRPRGDACRREARAQKTVGHCNAAAINERPPAGHVLTRQAEGSVAGDALDHTFGGSCGFTVAVGKQRPSAGAGRGPPKAGQRLAFAHPGMCHHYTWDGLHCVRSGLGSEHANRCSGQLRVVGGAVHQHICEAVGMPGVCSKVGDDLLEAVCCAPALIRAVCTPECCPFLAEGGVCPFDFVGSVNPVYSL